MPNNLDPHNPRQSANTNTKTHVTCNGDGNGAIDFSVSGGTAPYDISWTGPANGSQNDAINVSGGSYQITGLSGGDYDVTITDDNGCILNSNSNTIFLYFNDIVSNHLKGGPHAVSRK